MRHPAIAFLYTVGNHRPVLLVLSGIPAAIDKGLPVGLELQIFFAGHVAIWLHHTVGAISTRSIHRLSLHVDHFGGTGDDVGYHEAAGKVADNDPEKREVDSIAPLARWWGS